MLKIHLFYINFLNFFSVKNNNEPYLNLSSFYNEFFFKICEDSPVEKNKQLIKLLNLQIKFKTSDFLIKITIGLIINIFIVYFLIDRKIINKEESKHYKKCFSIYTIINSILFSIYFYYQNESFLQANLLEKIIFFLEFIGFYFLIKEISYKILIKKVENNPDESLINIQSPMYKGDILLIGTFIILSFLYIRKIKYNN